MSSKNVKTIIHIMTEEQGGYQVFNSDISHRNASLTNIYKNLKLSKFALNFEMGGSPYSPREGENICSMQSHLIS